MKYLFLFSAMISELDVFNFSQNYVFINKVRYLERNPMDCVTFMSVL